MKALPRVFSPPTLSFSPASPWFARYAYEVLVFPHRPTASLADLDDARCEALGESLLAVTRAYDKLWNMPMPCGSMAIHQAPSTATHPACTTHSTSSFIRRCAATTLKYLAGPEIGGGSMTNDPTRTRKPLS
ncbi:MAG: hypothetical protein R2748_31435 [Bryobacterales bacterium]